MDEEEAERLSRSKVWIEKHISELEQELDHLRQLLTVVEGYTSGKVARVAEAPPAPPAQPAAAPPRPPPLAIEPTPPTYEQIIPLKAADGTLLGSLFLGRNEMKITPTENITFRVSTPPLQQFLINKVLNGMAAKDREDAVSGTIQPDEILSYRIHQDGENLREVIIRNLGDEQRVTTLRNSIRWTLEKMWEKMKLRG